jgi:hypothetical protein
MVGSKASTISLLILGVSAWGLYKKYYDVPEEDVEGSSSSGSVSNSGATSNADISGGEKKTSQNYDDQNVSVSGVPDIVVNDAVKLSNTHKSSGSGKKVSFEYDSNTQKNEISINNKVVGAYDYKNNVSVDYSIKKKASTNNDFVGPQPKEKSSFLGRFF